MALAIIEKLCNKHTVKMLELMLLAFLIFSTAPVFAEDVPDELVFISGHDVDLTPAEFEGADRSGMDRQISFFDLPLWIQVAYISGSIGTILGSLIIFPAVVRKIKRSLINDNRESIINFIASNPGCTVSHIMQKENITKGTVRYHINKLKYDGKIVLKRIGNSFRIFISSRALSDKEKMVAALTSNEVDRKILYTIFDARASTNQCLSEKLNISKSSMHKRLKKIYGKRHSQM